MSQRTRWIFNSLLGLLALVNLSACATDGEGAGLREPTKSAPPKQEVFAAPYDHVWRALQLALAMYPIMVNDADTGVIETDFIRGEKAWVSPPRTEFPPGGYRYKIIVRAARGSDPETHSPRVKVTILKQAEVQRDFFSSFEKKPSDGLEELAIAYRIKRELKIERGLQRAAKKGSGQSAAEDTDF